MNESALIQFRVDEKLKEEATKILEDLGLDLPTGMRMFLKRVVLDQGLPFSTTLPKDLSKESNKSSTQVIRIPAKRCVKIPSEIVEFIIRQVPAGKITRYEDIQQFLQSAYGYERVELEHESATFFYGTILSRIGVLLAALVFFPRGIVFTTMQQWQICYEKMDFQYLWEEPTKLCTG